MSGIDLGIDVWIVVPLEEITGESTGLSELVPFSHLC